MLFGFIKIINHWDGRSTICYQDLSQSPCTFLVLMFGCIILEHTWNICYLGNGIVLQWPYILQCQSWHKPYLHLIWQVCNLAWSKNVNELVSTHGFSQNQIIVWRYPTMSKVCWLFSPSLEYDQILLFPYLNLIYVLL